MTGGLGSAGKWGRQREFEGWAGPWRADVSQSPPRPQEQDDLALDRTHM